MNRLSTRTVLAALALQLLNYHLAFAGATSLGEAAAARASVRANGMGDAYAAAGGDVSGFYYNPAQAAPKSAAFTFWRGYSDDTTSIFSGYFPKLVEGVNIGASFLYYTAGDMDLYGPNGTIGTVNAERDYMGVLNASKEFGIFSFGVNAKLLRTTLFETASGSAFLADGGVKARLPWLDLGAAVQNIGKEIELGSEHERLPRTVRFGAYRGFETGRTGVNLAADIVKTENENTYFSGGVELVYKKMLSLRTGYEFQNTLAQANMLRFGFGVKAGDFSLDYALVPYKDLGSTHRFSVTYAFGPKAEPVPEKNVPAESLKPVEAVSSPVVSTAAPAEQVVTPAAPAAAPAPAPAEAPAAAVQAQPATATPAEPPAPAPSAAPAVISSTEPAQHP